MASFFRIRSRGEGPIFGNKSKEILSFSFFSISFMIYECIGLMDLCLSGIGTTIKSTGLGSILIRITIVLLRSGIMEDW